MGIFKKRQYGVVNLTKEEALDLPIVPDGTWVKCGNCGKILYKKVLEENYTALSLISLVNRRKNPYQNTNTGVPTAAPHTMLRTWRCV